MRKILLTVAMLSGLSVISPAQTGWILQNPSTININNNLKTISFSSAGGTYLGTDTNCYYYSSNSGNSWNKISTPKNFNFVKFLNSSVGFAVSQNKIYKTIDSGISWDTVNTGMQNISTITDLNILSESSFICVANMSMSLLPRKVMKTTNGGFSWNQTFYESDVFVGPYYQTVTISKLKMLDENTGYFIDIHQCHYMLGGSGVLKKTTNGGYNWQDVFSLSCSELYDFSFIDNSTGYCTTVAVLYRTTNSGINWSFVSNGNCHFVNFINYNTGFLYNIYTRQLTSTSNAGLSWNLQLEFALSTPSLKAMGFINSSTGFIAGDNSLLYKTTDGGAVSVHNISNTIPEHYYVSQNYPNPFNPSTKINFSIPKSGLVQIKVYDLMGRELQTLLNEFKVTGEYKVDFDGSKLASGVYFYKLITNDFIETKKMMLVK
ncbi:MAG: T9SS type A sorting domain-containing protein [Ignavibacteria bacterium]|nr:T9SS type A sorting domain-containing protein [Ignavibacteria bacterium]